MVRSNFFRSATNLLTASSHPQDSKADCPESTITREYTPKGPKYLYGTKYGFCGSNSPYGLPKYSPYGYLGPFGYPQPLLIGNIHEMILGSIL